MISGSSYINGSSCISPQHTIEKDLDLLGQDHAETRILCVEPNYKELVGSIIGRRMGKLTKMGVTTAKLALDEAKLEMPDAIITGTGLGCMIDTEKFLLSVLENNEEMLNPTAFMQSTHNTIGGQIALGLGCKNYNFTYVHQGFSFESALLDSMMKIEEGDANNVLVGGFDEITENHFQITKRLGYWKDKSFPSTKLFENQGKGTIAGENAGFFVLSDKPNSNCCTRIAGIDMFNSPSIDKIPRKISDFLSLNGLNIEDLDLVLLGSNGDEDHEKYYSKLVSENPKMPIARYKHLCGENYTNGAFAMWLGEQIIKNQQVPQICFPENLKGEKIKNILIYSHYRNKDHSVYLLKNCLGTTQ